MFDLTPFRKRGTTELWKEMEDISRHFWRDFPFMEMTLSGEKEWTPRLDVIDTDKTVEVKADLPGLDRKDIDITLDRDTLTIKGEKKHEEETKERHYYRVERRTGTFYRTIRLPAEVNPEKIDATFKDGVLTVTLPKLEGRKSHVKHIDVH